MDIPKSTNVSLLQNPFFRESKRNRMEHEYESEREPRSILQIPHVFTIVGPMCLDAHQPRQHVVCLPSLPLDSPSKAAIRRNAVLDST